MDLKESGYVTASSIVKGISSSPLEDCSSRWRAIVHVTVLMEAVTDEVIVQKNLIVYFVEC